MVKRPWGLGKRTKEMALKEAYEWVDQHYKAGAKQIGVSCNPIQRKIFLLADQERMIIYCSSRQETRIIKDVLHDYIGNLPQNKV